MTNLFASGCPGAARLKTPTLTEKVCPVCGSIIEIFSVDVTAKCDNCGFVAYNDTQSCIQWCKYAEMCIGPELYAKLVKNAPGAAQNAEENKNEDKTQNN